MPPNLPTTLPAFFWHFARKRPVAFAVFFLTPCLLILEVNVLPYSLKLIIDTLVGFTGDRTDILSALAPALWLYGGSFLVLVIAIRLQHGWQAYVIPQFEADIRMSVLSYLSFHSAHYFADQLAGTLANKVHDLPRAMESLRINICWNVISGASTILVALILMGFIYPVLTLILLVWVLIHLTIAYHFARQVDCISAENAEDKSRLSGCIVDMISNVMQMKLFARRPHELAYIGKRQAQEMGSNKRLITRMNLFFMVQDIAVLMMMGGVFFAIITGWQQGKVGAGDVAFIVYSISNIMNQMWHLGHALTDIFREIGVARQALSLLSVPHTVVDAKDAKPLQVERGEIVFEQVTFHYVKNNHIFRDKNVVIPAGQKVGLVGFSGSGKTTFSHLILRFFDVNGGRITIDGQDIAHVTQDSLHEQIAMIPQDTQLFHRSMMENIRYGKLEACDEEVIEAAKKAHCHEFIEQLPEKYQALVGERGVKLSGGQRQRIAIARAILKNAPILILDEATSALDSMTEKLIQESLHSLMQNRTTIVIAHRLSTLSEMDRILVFDKGAIIEDGTHEQLMAKKSHYARMWQMQAGGFLPEREI